MAEINAPNLEIIALFGSVSFAFITFHTYKYDGFRCLIPRRKVWFRCLLIYMLILSNACFLIWAWCWSYVKVQLGMVRFGPSGARPWPSALFPDEFSHYNAPLTVLFGISYGLQACLTVEEALYFYHLMRCVRRPQAAIPFLKSKFFKVWVAVSLAIMAVQQCVPWVTHDDNLENQLSKELLAGGLIELIVLGISGIVVLKFPRFLKDIEVLGAGPDVRIRLYTYHSLNKTRTWSRLTFSLPLLILGADGHTKAMVVNMHPLATDLLATTIGASLPVVMMISIILYLPRSSPRSPHDQLVGRVHGNGPGASALMSILRDDGQWEGLDDDLAPVTGKADRGLSRYEEAPFAAAKVGGPDGRGGWKDLEMAQPHVPQMLSDFSSPIAVSTEAQPQGPIRIQMHVERDIHKDEGSTIEVAPRLNRE